MNDIRRKALARRLEIGLTLHDPTPADGVLNACGAATGLTREFLSPDDPLLAGAYAVLDCQLEAIWQDSTRPLPESRFDAAHEFAHVWLHGGSCHCGSDDLNPLDGGEGGALRKVDGYSSRQKREAEANLFAAEMLLPGPLARRLFLDEGQSAEAIAESLGLPAAVVQRQLIDSVLLPPVSEKTSGTETAPAAQPAALDPSQKNAAEIEHGPLLLGAGPGTGKTKTLIGRCQFLTQSQGIPAEKILALTFSRQAAQEMRERLALSGVGTRDAGPWVGTFHSFGLDILRRFGERMGLPAEMKLLDTLDGVTLLENHLPELQLEALDNLYNPAVHLGGILKQISRAKDELCPPERYAHLCAEMQTQAEQRAAELAAKPGKTLKKDADAVSQAFEQAAKASEVARCYQIYQTLLTQEGFLDFADLIARSVSLLETFPDVLQTLQAEFPHVLADEYQDVNRACARLVKLLAGDDARGLWAVGDHRQSIYRFRGASPANVAAFGRDYPGGTRLELGINYRSRTPIVELFGTAARGMGATYPQPPPQGGGGESNLPETFPLNSPLPPGEGVGGRSLWHAQRGADTRAAFPAVTLAVAPDEDGQAEGIVGAIEALKAAGKPYSEQAILCRTHGQAAALAGHLSARSVPALYLGALLERPEIKDLLCLLSLLADKDGSGLLRVASWPEYGVPQEETLALLTQVQADAQLNGTALLEALQDGALPGGLRRLGAHLAELDTMDADPAVLLRHYLFGQSHYLRHLQAREPKAFLGMQQRLAIHQLLGLAATFDGRLVSPGGQSKEPPNNVREFLTHLRRMTAAGETLRGVAPPEADTLDAVRILTAHAAKGLEYPVVFLPNLGAGQFPARGRHDGIPEPPGLADAAGQDADEEDCLFFVALSRARDHLIISRSETSGTDKPVKPSPLLALLQPWFTGQGIAETYWRSGRVPQETQDDTTRPDTLPVYSSSALELYERCPRQYYYERVLKLEGTFTLGGYPQFHGCVRRTLHWLDDERAAGNDPAVETIGAKLDAVWAEHGPVGHLHEEKYKNSARGMLRVAAEAGDSGEERLGASTLQATLHNCRVRVRPDVVRLAPADGVLVVARQLTGKPGDEDKNDKRLALFRRAAQETHPDRPLRLELRYLSDGAVTEIEPPATDYKAKLEADRVAKYDSAAQGIAGGRFPARRGDVCQTCAYALICPL